MIKPDAVGRRLVGEIIRRYESKGLKLVGLKMQKVSRQVAEQQYAEHKGKAFYANLVEFITSGPAVLVVLEGDNAIAVVRKLNGTTESQEAELGTIRGDFGMSVRHNLVHAADSPEVARREIPLYFEESELLNYPMPDERWVQGT